MVVACGNRSAHAGGHLVSALIAGGYRRIFIK
jgi:hypothetical protein